MWLLSAGRLKKPMSITRKNRLQRQSASAIRHVQHLDAHALVEQLSPHVLHTVPGRPSGRSACRTPWPAAAINSCSVLKGELAGTRPAWASRPPAPPAAGLWRHQKAASADGVDGQRRVVQHRASRPVPAPPMPRRCAAAPPLFERRPDTLRALSPGCVASRRAGCRPFRPARRAPPA